VFWIVRLLLSMQRLQREIQSHLPDLDHLSKLYRELARHGRNDVAGELREKVDDASRRWDSAAKHIRGIVKTVSRAHTISVDLDESLESLTVWLNDVDVRLTRLQQLSDDVNAASKADVLKVSCAIRASVSTDGCLKF
jgi:ABC-type transporter Mla subunit MlaD